MKSRQADFINVMGSPLSVFNKNSFILPLLLSTFTLLLYGITLSPTINFGDSPELISSAYTLGMSHPPGYPLYSLTGKFFSLIPWSDSVAQRINLASAFYTATSIFLLTLLMERSGVEYAKGGMVFLAAFLALSTTLWSQSVVSEVYTLNLLFFSLLLLLSFLCWKSHDRRYLLAVFFLYGLGLGNHHTLISFAPLLFLFLLAGWKREIINVRFVPLLFFFALLGFSVYLFMPLRSVQAPAMDWGDPESLKNFFEVLLRRQFPTIEQRLTPQQAMVQFVYYGKVLIREFTLAGVLPAAWGLIRSYKLGRAPFFFLVSLFLIHGIGTLLVLNPTTPESLENVDAMMIPSFAIVSLWIGLALSDLTALCMKRKFAMAATAVLFAAISVPLINKTPSTFRKNDESGNYFALDYAANMFKSMDRDALIFVESDTALFPLWYLQFVEGVRPDVAVIDVDFLMLPWFKGQVRERYKNVDIRVEDLSAHSSRSGRKVDVADMLDAFKVNQMESIMEEFITERPIYISYEFGPVYRSLKELKGVYVIDEGLIYKVSKIFEKRDVEKWDTFELRSLLRYRLSQDPTIRVLATAYINPLKRKGQLLYNSGKREEAMLILKRIKEIEAGVAGIE